MVVSLGEFTSHKADRIEAWRQTYLATYTRATRPRPHNADVVQAERLEPRWFKHHHRLFPAGPTTELNPRTGIDVWWPIEQPEDLSPFHPALLKNEDDATYVGPEFMVRKESRARASTALLGGEVIGVEITEYRPAYSTCSLATRQDERNRILKQRERVERATCSPITWDTGNSTWVARYFDTRLEYEELQLPESMAEIRCAVQSLTACQLQGSRSSESSWRQAISRRNA